MQKDYLAIIFDLDGILYYSPLSLVHLTRKIISKLGFQNINDYSDDEILETIASGPEAWLSEFMLDNNVGPTWIPSHDMWLNYSEQILRSFRVNPSSRITAISLKMNWEEYGPLGRTVFHPCLVDESVSVLNELYSRGYKLGLVTNRFYNPSPFLAQDSILKYFKAVKHTGVVGFKKPSPYMLMEIAKHLKINPLRCAYVGDQIDIDGKSAAYAGMLPIIIGENTISKELFKDYIFLENIQELLDIFP